MSADSSLKRRSVSSTGQHPGQTQGSRRKRELRNGRRQPKGFAGWDKLPREYRGGSSWWN